MRPNKHVIQICNGKGRKRYINRRNTWKNSPILQWLLSSKHLWASKTLRPRYCSRIEFLDKGKKRHKNALAERGETKKQSERITVNRNKKKQKLYTTKGTNYLVYYKEKEIMEPQKQEWGTPLQEAHPPFYRTRWGSRECVGKSRYTDAVWFHTWADKHTNTHLYMYIHISVDSNVSPKQPGFGFISSL